MTARISLSKSDWIHAGFKALTSGGPQAVKVEKIARALKVSKGSYYWHFKNADALKHDMLKYWVDIGTKEIIAQNQKGNLSPTEKLMTLGSRITEKRDVEYGGILAEAAIRDWSRFDKDVSKIVRRVNKSRLKYIAKLFSDLGVAPDESELKAAALYSALIGLEFLEHQRLTNMKESMDALVKLMTRPEA